MGANAESIPYPWILLFLAFCGTVVPKDGVLVKKFILCLLCAVLLLSVATPALACPDKEGFTCWILEPEMPKDAVYVDLLLPISTADEKYTSLNQENAQKYGFGADTPIVRYCEDGYQSYAFHMQGACSTLVPTQICKINMPRELFVAEIKKDELFTIENFAYETSMDPKAVEKERIVADTRYPYLSGRKELLDTFCFLNGLKPSYDPYLFLHYCVTDENGKTVDFKPYAQKYKYAKLAYLDAEGNVLAVTDEGKMHNKGLFLTKKTVFTAYGTHIDEEISNSMSPFAFGFIGVTFALLVLAFGVFFIYGVRKIKGKKEPASKTEEA